MARPETPLVAADVVIRLEDRPDKPIVLIERHNPPYGWALPGGFVDVDETVSAAAVREAREETGLDVELQALIGCYSAPGRDPRGPTISVVFAATATGEPKAGDDAKNWQPVDPESRPELAFDHALILDDYCDWLSDDGYRARVR
jgi:8-oxo-dGTP diphosphatase